jgi:hypothetical protein
MPWHEPVPAVVTVPCRRHLEQGWLSMQRPSASVRSADGRALSTSLLAIFSCSVAELPADPELAACDASWFEDGFAKKVRPVAPWPRAWEARSRRPWTIPASRWAAR